MTVRWVLVQRGPAKGGGLPRAAARLWGVHVPLPLCQQTASQSCPTAGETGGLVCGSPVLPWTATLPCPPT